VPSEPVPQEGEKFLTNGLGTHSERRELTIEKVHAYVEQHDTWTVRAERKQYEIYLEGGVGWVESDARGYLSTGG
jgi:hypothetical protein